MGTIELLEGWAMVRDGAEIAGRRTVLETARWSDWA